MITKNTKIFAATLVIGMSFAVGINASTAQLTDFLFSHKLRNNPQLYAAVQFIANEESTWQPQKNQYIENPAIAGAAAYSAFLGNQTNQPQTLFSKNGNKPFPIASVSKLMTAVIAKEHYDPNDTITITERLLTLPENGGGLQENETLTIQELFYPLLMESSNEIAQALAEKMGEEQFVALMNDKARSLGLRNTAFQSATGLDKEGTASNTASPQDIATLASYIIERHPELFLIMGTKEHSFQSNGGVLHELRNTNELLLSNAWRIPVVAGKTGTTPQAQGALLIILEVPDKKGYIVNIILGAQDRFGEMKKFTDWILAAYSWN